jgi:aspartate beta-hydroxylase
MSLNDAHISILTRQGVAAIKAGQSVEARKCFEDIIAARKNLPGAYLGLAYACNQQGDAQAMQDAIEHVLVLEPANIYALILKADYLQISGDKRQALGFYQGALTATSQLRNIPEDMQDGLKRAQHFVQKSAAEYADYMRQALLDKGIDVSKTHRRFALAFDLAIGQSQLYVQQPTRFYYPELPQIQFYERSDFDWVEALEAATDDIREELLAVLREDSNFPPYLMDVKGIPHLNNQDLINNPSWGAFFFWKNGPLIDENALRCPKTLAALENVPLPHITNHTPSALFSLLKPGTRIPPHNGMLNTRLICHLPLIVPKNCGALRVGSEERPWVEGKTMIFDDSIEHEAWNNSDKTRVVLLFDIWRPELSPEERDLITAMLESADAYAGE